MKQNYIQELGAMALGTRLKQLTEKLMKDMVKVYHELHVDFEPRWFTFMYLLNTEGKLSLTEVAKRLNQSHVAANQVANLLEKKKLITSVKDKHDQRKRILMISSKGITLVKELEPVWSGVESAVEQLLKDANSDLFGEIEKIEHAIQHQSMYKRINDHVNAKIRAQAQIVPYRPVHKLAFIDLNLAWLEKYFVVEPHDHKLLFNPDEEIIEKGGKILMVTYLDDVIGTVALLKVNNHICEMTKMAVSEKLQGRGIGRQLLNHAFQDAKEMGFKKLTLLTSPKLERAMHLYKSFGFIESKEPSLLLSHLDRSSIQMEIAIK